DLCVHFLSNYSSMSQQFLDNEAVHRAADGEPDHVGKRTGKSSARRTHVDGFLAVVVEMAPRHPLPFMVHIFRSHSISSRFSRKSLSTTHFPNTILIKGIISAICVNDCAGRSWHESRRRQTEIALTTVRSTFLCRLR